MGGFIIYIVIHRLAPSVTPNRGNTVRLIGPLITIRVLPLILVNRFV